MFFDNFADYKIEKTVRKGMMATQNTRNTIFFILIFFNECVIFVKNPTQPDNLLAIT